MKTPLVSVVNATYNQADWVKNLLESLNSQTYKGNIEIIIVGDGCTDNTKDVVAEFKKEHGHKFMRVLFVDKPHSGVQETRNLGLETAVGDYVIFPDSDCYLYDTCVSEMVEMLNNNPGIAYVYCDMENIGHYSNIFTAGHFSEDRLRKGNFITVCSMMRLNEDTPRWDPEIKRLQDYDLWLSWLDKGFYGGYIPRVLFRHHTRADSLTFTSIPIDQAYRDVHKKHGILK
jgi:glycosyltransferase involved in cell wall biosynthesis